jgi:hypothetical protein
VGAIFQLKSFSSRHAMQITSSSVAFLKNVLKFMRNFLIPILIISRGIQMKTRVKDLTVMELQNLIADTVKASMEEVLEDIGALSSKEYLHSIKKARRDKQYK